MNHEIKIKTTLKGFPVPDFVEVEATNLPRGVSIPPRVELKDLSQDQLLGLVADFRDRVFEKAKQPTRVEVQG